ncbi:Glycosyltransferase involved in cell wall bisynthesis [Methylobacterium sp. 174MFSha1.1]|uniref:glycosyltransferase n=1 Tax=Methylobacterium sp. 174MFSha1.1 TaxID=1502749 RepID=UPI0008E3A3DB|nr:glycosyltransferase [Methylobacterium sp. 174MFSha1.1]SFU46696.1 Glycosyltransferase involved in cell wall bisynthesis [Methylobacterium sp. 174MFSha1.1]
MNPEVVADLHRLIEGDVTLWCRYFLRQDLHAQYGFRSTASYLHCLAEILLARRAPLPRPPVIPDSLLAALIARGAAGEPSFLDHVVRGLGSPEAKEGDDTEVESAVAHLLPLDLIRDTLRLRRRSAAELEAAKSNAFEQYLSYLDGLGLSRRSKNEGLRSICIVGFHRSVLGVGEDARRLTDVLLALGYRIELIDLSSAHFPVSGEAPVYDAFEVRRPTAPVLIFCMPLSEISRVWASIYPNISAGRHVIAYAPWELTRLPRGCDLILAACDEVWCSTSYQHEVYQAVAGAKARLVPFYVKAPDPERDAQVSELLAGKFNLLFAFDFNSRIERKNPLGLVDAFQRAFPRRQTDVQLVLKTINAEANPAAFELLIAAIGEDDRVVVLDGDLPPSAMAYLISESDVFVSLHRAEGFGRLLAEAMLLGTLVICTGHSGSRDFAKSDTALVVDHTLIPVAPEQYPLAAGHWAEPDLRHAASLMMQAYGDPTGGRVKREAARRFVASRFGLAPVAERIHAQIEAILPREPESRKC